MILLLHLCNLTSHVLLPSKISSSTSLSMDPGRKYGDMANRRVLYKPTNRDIWLGPVRIWDRTRGLGGFQVVLLQILLAVMLHQSFCMFPILTVEKAEGKC